MGLPDDFWEDDPPPPPPLLPPLSPPTFFIKARRLNFPLFEISSITEIPLTQLKDFKFDTLDWSRESSLDQIQRDVDLKLFEGFDAITK